MNAGASLSAVPSPIEGSGTAWVLLGSWALSPARPTPIPPRHECRGFSALLVKGDTMILIEKTLAILAALARQTWHNPLVRLLLMVAVCAGLAWRVCTPSGS